MHVLHVKYTKYVQSFYILSSSIKSYKTLQVSQTMFARALVDSFFKHSID